MEQAPRSSVATREISSPGMRGRPATGFRRWTVAGQTGSQTCATSNNGKVGGSSLNYLAHLYLAGDDPDLLVGSLMGDFVRGPVPGHLPESMQRGIVLHRNVDTFTDAHPTFRRSCARVGQPHRRYAGIIVDLVYDHCLARSWPIHHPVALDVYAAEVYRILEERRSSMPTGMRDRVASMIQNNLLVAYREEGTIRNALWAIGKRFRKPVNLAGAIEHLHRDQAGFEDDFREFFPQLTRFADARLRSLAPP